MEYIKLVSCQLGGARVFIRSIFGARPMVVMAGAEQLPVSRQLLDPTHMGGSHACSVACPLAAAPAVQVRSSRAWWVGIGC